MDKCVYCDKPAAFWDIAEVDEDTFDYVDVCRCHLNMEASS
jgi:hypothetical protein